MAPEAMSARRTVLYEQHRASGARLVDFAGWRMPVTFSGVLEEHRAVREHVGLFDVSHMARFLLAGPGALSELNALTVSDLRALEVGSAKYTCCCDHSGGILDDVIVYRLRPDELLLVCNASNAEKMRAHCQAHLSDATSFEDATERTALVAVQGPSALAKLEEALGLSDVATRVPPFHVTEVAFEGSADAWVARTGYTGEDGCEVMLPATKAVALWQRLLADGGIAAAKPIGLAARDTLRLEARLSLYGNEIDETTNPYEAGLKWLVQLEGADFVGKGALERLAREPLTRKLVGFEMKARAIARSGYPVVSPEGEVLGRCTSGAPSPTLGKNIGLAYVPADQSSIGTRIDIDCRGRLAEAEVVRTPFYRRKS